MSEVSKSLQHITLGAGIIFIGTIIEMTLGFVRRIIIIRYITQSEYGIYCLALVLLNIFVFFSMIGLPEGIARYIAYFRGKEDEDKVVSVIRSSFWIMLTTSLIASFIFFLSSDYLSDFFNSPALTTPLKIFSIAIPFIVFTNTLIAIFRGFGKVSPNVYFQNILKNILFILFLVITIFLGLSFIGVIYAYLVSAIVTSIAFITYTFKKLPYFSLHYLKGNINPMGKELLLFSLPLFATATVYMIMNWTDTLMLGYFKTPEVVGLYNAAMPLARFIPIFLSSAGFIYVPIASNLYSRNLINEIGRTYQILTKWIFSATLPVFFILFLFPEVILKFLFGDSYVPATLTLKILTLGFMFHTFLGLNGLSLMVIGETRFLMFATLLAAIVNVILNAVLIPSFGIEGAAVSSAVAYILLNVLISLKLYQKAKIHPFSLNYIKILIISLTLLAFIEVFVSSKIISIWQVLCILTLFLTLYFFLVILSRSVDKEDIDLFLAIVKKLGIELGVIKKILRRFV